MRPTLNDPAEYALIKKMYFVQDVFQSDEIDPIELNERMESKIRNSISPR